MRNPKQQCLLVVIKDFTSRSTHQIYRPNDVYVFFKNKLQQEYENVATRYVLAGVPDEEVNEKQFLSPVNFMDKTRHYGLTKTLEIIDLYDYTENDVFVLVLTDSLSRLYTPNTPKEFPEIILDKTKLLFYMEFSNRHNCSELKTNLLNTWTPNVVCPEPSGNYTIYDIINSLQLSDFASYLDKVRQLDLIRIEKHEAIKDIVRQGKKVSVILHNKEVYEYEWPKDESYNQDKCFTKAYVQYIQKCLDNLFKRASVI